jgi:hypothetical protein
MFPLVGWTDKVKVKFWLGRSNLVEKVEELETASADSIVLLLDEACLGKTCSGEEDRGHNENADVVDTRAATSEGPKKRILERRVMLLQGGEGEYMGW